MNLNQSFLEELDRLNDKQRLAVETIEGPVMVIAGPGTGKTQILAARIGAILSSPDTQARPENILCLTYTDAGAVAMRKRLLRFIGPDAYRVNIFTFHAFCNQVIRDNSELFGVRDLEPISELEQVQILRRLIDALPSGNVLKRYGGDIYTDLYRLRTLFSQMKREKLDAGYISKKIDEYLADLPNRDEYIYKRATKDAKPGDLKKKELEAEKMSMERTRAAANLFAGYQQLMAEEGRYDFDDMITWVTDAFSKNEDLLRRYQEQFLYVLVDEYQDTSGTQNYLLHQLIEFWDVPNIFVVGDDDQSIYSFQGANLRNINDFVGRYGRNLQSIVLDKNYRSSQLILDTAREVISRNANRLSPDKHLEALNTEVAALSISPEVRAYYNEVHEIAGIAENIISLKELGAALSEVAILYSKHRQAEDLSRYLQSLGIPVNIKRRINVLEEPLISRLVNLLHYISLEAHRPHSGEELLFPIMHDECFGLDSMEVARFAMQMRNLNGKARWREELYKQGNNGQGDLFSTPAPLKKFSLMLEGWIKDVHNITLQQLIERLVTESGLIQKIAGSEERLWHMELLHTFFDFVKEETQKKPTLKVTGLIEVLGLMKEHNISLPLQKVSYSPEGVNFITVHSAKGLEYDHIFLMGCTKEEWDSSRGNFNFKFPDTIVPFVSTDETEEKRRLFYVALTRARKNLVVSYPERNSSKEKALEKSRFVAETDTLPWVEKRSIALPSEKMEQYLLLELGEQQSPGIALLEKAYLDKLLEDYSLSVTHLNAYLRCPLAFYYNSLLRIPAAKSAALTFGSAVHKGLERFFKKMQADGGKEFPALEVLMSEFEWQMKKHRDAFTERDYKLRMDYGREILPLYYRQYQPTWNKVTVLEYRIQNIEAFGIPVNGMLDKLEFNGKDVNVVDYKTGSYEKAKNKFNPPSANAENETDPVKKYGGDYWRQAAFYKILMDHDTQHRDWNMVSAEFDFIEPDRKTGEFRKQQVYFRPEDTDLVRQQMEYAYSGIMDHKFSQGCGQPDCQWCGFVKEYKVPAPSEE